MRLSHKSSAQAYLAEGVLFNGKPMTRRQVYEWFSLRGYHFVRASKWMEEYDKGVMG